MTKLGPNSAQYELETFLEEFFIDLFTQLNAIRHSHPRRKLEALALKYLDYWLENPDRFRMVFLVEDTAATQPGYFVESSALVNRFKLFETAVEQAQQKGLLGKTDPVVQGLMCALNGLALNLITISELPWANKSRLSKTTLKAYLDGLGSVI